MSPPSGCAAQRDLHRFGVVDGSKAADVPWGQSAERREPLAFFSDKRRVLRPAFGVSSLNRPEPSRRLPPVFALHVFPTTCSSLQSPRCLPSSGGLRGVGWITNDHPRRPRPPPSATPAKSPAPPKPRATSPSLIFSMSRP